MEDIIKAMQKMQYVFAAETSKILYVISQMKRDIIPSFIIKCKPQRSKKMNRREVFYNNFEFLYPILLEICSPKPLEITYTAQEFYREFLSKNAPCFNEDAAYYLEQFAEEVNKKNIPAEPPEDLN